MDGLFDSFYSISPPFRDDLIVLPHLLVVWLRLLSSWVFDGGKLGTFCFWIWLVLRQLIIFMLYSEDTLCLLS